MYKPMKRIYLLIILTDCFALGYAQNTTSMEQVRKLVLAHSAITNLYVDKVDEPKIVEASVIAMLK